jgi:hypothetical protein
MSFTDAVSVSPQNGGAAVYGTPDQSIVTFFKSSRQNTYRSAETGIPTFDDIDMVRVVHPGEGGFPIETEANAMHKHRWPRQWDAYVKGEEGKIAGTPLDFLFPASPATVKMLQGHQIHTVQQLRDLSATAIARTPQLQPFQTQAVQYCEAAAKGTEHHVLVGKNAALEADLRTANSDIEELKKQVGALMSVQSVKIARGEASIAEDIERAAPPVTATAQTRTARKDGKNPFDVTEPGEI